MTNKAIIIGNVTRDLELKTTQSGFSVVNFTVAVTRSFNKQGGEKQTDFIPVVAWRQLAELCSRYLHKGSKVCVTGMIQSRSYETQDGQKRTAIEIVADDVEFLTPPGQSGQTGQYGGSAQYGSSGGSQEITRSPGADVPFESAGFMPVDDDELPF